MRLRPCLKKTTSVNNQSIEQKTPCVHKDPKGNMRNLVVESTSQIMQVIDGFMISSNNGNTIISLLKNYRKCLGVPLIPALGRQEYGSLSLRTGLYIGCFQDKKSKGTSQTIHSKFFPFGHNLRCLHFSECSFINLWQAGLYHECSGNILSMVTFTDTF